MSIQTDQVPKKTTWKTGVEALKDALNTEAAVTKSIRQVISVCENDKDFNKNNDYHVSVAWLSPLPCAPFLLIIRYWLKSNLNFIFFRFQLVDYLTGDFLEEQYTGQRDLAGKVSTLDRMMKGQGELAEFLYDKQLLV